MKSKGDINIIIVVFIGNDNKLQLYFFVFAVRVRKYLVKKKGVEKSQAIETIVAVLVCSIVQE